MPGETYSPLAGQPGSSHTHPYSSSHARACCSVGESRALCGSCSSTSDRHRGPGCCRKPSPRGSGEQESCKNLRSDPFFIKTARCHPSLLQPPRSLSHRVCEGNGGWGGAVGIVPGQDRAWHRNPPAFPRLIWWRMGHHPPPSPLLFPGRPTNTLPPRTPRLPSWETPKPSWSYSHPSTQGPGEHKAAGRRSRRGGARGCARRPAPPAKMFSLGVD